MTLAWTSCEIRDEIASQRGITERKRKSAATRLSKALDLLPVRSQRSRLVTRVPFIELRRELEIEAKKRRSAFDKRRERRTKEQTREKKKRGNAYLWNVHNFDVRILPDHIAVLLLEMIEVGARVT